MKKQIFFYSILLVAIGSLGADVLHNVTIKSEIKEAFQKGNAKQLSSYFNDMVEFYFEETEGTVSRSQAESILIDFFSKNPPKLFEIIQEGTTNENVEFVIATYTTVYGCVYRVNYLIKKQPTSGKNERIFEIKITKNKQCQSKI